MDVESNDREKTALSLVVGMKMAMAQNKAAACRQPNQQGSTDGASGQNASSSKKQAKVSASVRPRPVIAMEAPVGAFPVAGINVSVERRESQAALEVPPHSPVLAHKQPNGSGIPRSGSSDGPQSSIPPHGQAPIVRPTNRDVLPQHAHTNGQHPQQPEPIRFSFATHPTNIAAQWRPTLSLDMISHGSAPATLRTVEVVSRPDLLPVFHLESHYMVRASLPRSFYSVMASNTTLKHSFVLSYPVGNKWWDDLFGMRKSTYIELRAEHSSVQWELHLKPTKDRSIFGYIVKHDELANMINNQKVNLLRTRRLPLVLDLDDTLVRLVGNERSRYVSETDAAKVPGRVRRLQDGRQVVFTEHVEEFLEWASRLFEISVCSLGDQTYVDQVTEVLDPLKTRIRGTRYSARQEYDFLNGPAPTPAPTLAPPQAAASSLTPSGEGVAGGQQEASSGPESTGSGISYIPVSSLSTAAITNAVIQATQPPLPPKDLLSLYAFCAATKPPSDGLPDIGNGFGLPLILDDLTQMWPPEQHDNVIVVKERKDSPVWTVNLFPMVQIVLGVVHQEFFRHYDAWVSARAAAVASITIPVQPSSSSAGVEGAETTNAANALNGPHHSSSHNGLTAIDFTATTPAKTAFLNMPIPSAIGCYKDWLRGSLRDLISSHAGLPAPHLTAAVAQQQQMYQQQQLQHQQPQQHPQHQQAHQPVQPPGPHPPPQQVQVQVQPQLQPQAQSQAQP
ncbi:unnamed protein product [Mortierella alpina]